MLQKLFKMDMTIVLKDLHVYQHRPLHHELVHIREDIELKIQSFSLNSPVRYQNSAADVCIAVGDRSNKRQQLESMVLFDPDFYHALIRFLKDSRNQNADDVHEQVYAMIK